jgi:hypothetical protein
MISPFVGCGELAKDFAPRSLGVFVERVKIHEAVEARVGQVLTAARSSTALPAYLSLAVAVF